MDAIIDGFCHVPVKILAQSDHCIVLLHRKEYVVGIDPFFASDYHLPA